MQVVGLNFKSVEKSRPLFRLGDEVNITVELINNELTDHEPQAYPVCVDFLLFVFEGAKHFKELVLILILDSFSSVNYRDS